MVTSRKVNGRRPPVHAASTYVESTRVGIGAIVANATAA
jgi:hypothetical protein